MKVFFLVVLGLVVVGGVVFEVWAHYYWQRRWLRAADAFERLGRELDRLKAERVIT